MIDAGSGAEEQTGTLLESCRLRRNSFTFFGGILERAPKAMSLR